MSAIPLMKVTESIKTLLFVVHDVTHWDLFTLSEKSVLDPLVTGFHLVSKLVAVFGVDVIAFASKKTERVTWCATEELETKSWSSNSLQ